MLSNFKKKLASTALGIAISIPTVAAFTGVAPINVAGISNTQPANAGFVETAINLFSPQNLWYNLNAGRFRQEYFTNIPPQTVQTVRDQYRAGADGVLNSMCTERAIRHYRLGWWESSMLWGGYRYFFIASRVEGGNYNNCYVRIAR